MAVIPFVAIFFFLPPRPDYQCVTKEAKLNCPSDKYLYVSHAFHTVFSVFLLVLPIAVSYLSKYLRLSDSWQLNPELSEDLQIPIECGQCSEVNLY